jgi:two-component system sensor histidine kinase MprB
VEFDVAVEPWWVDGEATSLERAVTNLLDNAAKWSPPGGTVTVRLAGGRLMVADEGPGIAEEDLGHVFDRFWRADESRGMPGSGLGLSIVAQVAERHSGRISAERAPSGGALFDLRMPGRPDAPADEPTPADADRLST